tara:strand:- start:1646 stop:1840 length:195 start_codon:yes stop_codon:yes gene_type:complete
MNTGDLVTYPLFDSPGVSGRSLGWNPHGRRRVGLLVGVDGFEQMAYILADGLVIDMKFWCIEQI